MNYGKRFSEDGYIIDQDLFNDVLYRTSPSNYNGCGWIAAYNLRHALGQDASWDDVLREMDSMHSVKLPGPTLMRVMRGYLNKYVHKFSETVGKKDAVNAALNSRAGIFRYWEQGVPHFVTFVKAPESEREYRFFNVNDDILDEKIDMLLFAKEHFLFGSVIALTVQ